LVFNFVIVKIDTRKTGMMNQDPEIVKEVLFTQIKVLRLDCFRHIHNGLVNQIETSTRYNGNGTVEAYLSFLPTSDICKESIDLIFSLACDQIKTIFSSEIALSEGRTIEEVVVSNMCPDCFDELQEKFGNMVARTQEPLVDRMVAVLENFCQE